MKEETKQLIRDEFNRQIGDVESFKNELNNVGITPSTLSALEYCLSLMFLLKLNIENIIIKSENE